MRTVGGHTKSPKHALTSPQEHQERPTKVDIPFVIDPIHLVNCVLLRTASPIPLASSDPSRQSSPSPSEGVAEADEHLHAKEAIAVPLHRGPAS